VAIDESRQIRPTTADCTDPQDATPGCVFPARMNQYCANIVIMNVIVALEATSVKRILLQCKTALDAAEILSGIRCELSFAWRLA
jgi:hypothetical protein